MDSSIKGSFYLLGAATLWSLGGLLIKVIPWPPLAVAGGRSLIAAIFISFFISWKNLKFDRAEIVAAIFYALTVTLFVSATKLTTAANAIFLQYTAPVYVIALGHFYLNERANRRDFATVFFVLVGMTLFFFEKVSLDGRVGNILALLSGVSFAVMTVLLRAQRNQNPLKSIFLGNLVTAILLSPFVWKAPTLDFMGFGFLLALGVFQLGLAYVLYSKAVPHVTALGTVLIAMLEPILNPIWVMISLGEIPSSMAVAGGGLILLSVLLRGVFSNNSVKKFF